MALLACRTGGNGSRDSAIVAILCSKVSLDGMCIRGEVTSRPSVFEGRYMESVMGVSFVIVFGICAGNAAAPLNGVLNCYVA